MCLGCSIPLALTSFGLGDPGILVGCGQTSMWDLIQLRGYWRPTYRPSIVISKQYLLRLPASCHVPVILVTHTVPGPVGHTEQIICESRDRNPESPQLLGSKSRVVEMCKLCWCVFGHEVSYHLVHSVIWRTSSI